MQSPKKLIPDPKVRQRYGGISAMTMWRWDQDPRLGFPKPIYIRGRKYRDERELDAFDEASREKLTNAVSPGALRQRGYRERHRNEQVTSLSGGGETAAIEKGSGKEPPP